MKRGWIAVAIGCLATLVVLGGCGRDGGESVVTPTVDSPTEPSSGVESPATYGSLPTVRSREARDTVAIMSRLGSAIEALEDATDQYPDVQRIEDLATVLVPRYLSDVPTLDGWGRPLRLEWISGMPAIRSAGADGQFESGAPRGPVDETGADIVFFDEGFQQWSTTG